MQKLSIPKLIAFRERKTERGKRSYVEKLKKPKEKVEGKNGGHYWALSLGAVNKAYRLNDSQIIIDKIKQCGDELKTKQLKPVTKVMYRKNIELLNGYQEFNFQNWQPAKKLKYLKKVNSILSIGDLLIQASPNQVFTSKRNDVEEVGGIWFVAKKGGYRQDELGMFADLLFRYLDVNYSDDYPINPMHCVVIDIVNGSIANYMQVQKREIPRVLMKTIKEIRELI